jgi:hypothetical protein
MTFNHRPTSTGYWIRYTLEAPVEGHGEPYAQLWFARFDAKDPSRTFAFNKKFPIAEMTATEAPFSVRIGDARLTHSSASGALSGDGHSARWNLTWEPAGRTHYHLPKVMYRRGGVGDTTVLTPNLDVPFSGTIEVDGETIELKAEPGGQTHLWGRKHAHEWAWGHCNAFENRPGAALETLSVRLKKAGRVLPRLTILSLYLDGEVFKWTEFQHTLLTKAEYDTAHYRFSARGARARLEGEYTCRPEDMVVAPYVDPDGEPSFCSNTEVADLRITVFKRSSWRARWQEHARLVAPHCGHFEVGGRERDPKVLKDHVILD